MNSVNILMSMNPLPPQAYTKETLQKAYAWLLTQNSSVKDMVHDQNILVSLYLKAQRNGDSALETPSIQNFKQELKSLANLMGDFQVSGQSTVAAPVQATQTPAAGATSVGHVHQQSVNVTAQAAAATFDAKTLSAIAEVRETFNLSSDTEAVRALVALGIKQFRKSSF